METNTQPALNTNNIPTNDSVKIMLAIFSLVGMVLNTVLLFFWPGSSQDAMSGNIIFLPFYTPLIIIFFVGLVGVKNPDLRLFFITTFLILCAGIATIIDFGLVQAILVAVAIGIFAYGQKFINNRTIKALAWVFACALFYAYYFRVF